MYDVQDWAIIATAGAVGVTLGLGAVKRVTANGPYFPSMGSRVFGVTPDFRKAFRFGSNVCRPELQPVFDTFKDTFRRGYQVESQLCVYSKGEKVLDVWGCPQSNASYDGDSVQPVFSCTKVLSAMVIAQLVDKGVLRYDDKVVQHWPEFAEFHAEKKEITIANLLRHEAGCALNGKGVFLTQAIAESPEAFAKFLAEQPVSHVEETKRQYHAIAAGFILNEVVKRVGTKRSIGTIVAEDIAAPLGIPYFIGRGYPPKGPMAPRHVEVGKYPSRIWCFFRVWFRLLVQGKPLDDPPAHIRPVSQMRKALFVYWPLLIRQNLNLWGYFDVFKGSPRETLKMFNSEKMHTFEMPGANGISCGSALARVAAVLAGRGQVAGTRLLGEETWRKSMEGKVTMKDAHIGMLETCWTQGGWCNMKDFSGTEGWWGWCGWGGHWIMFNPELEMSVGVAITGWRHDMLYDERMKYIVKSLMDVAPKV